MPSPRCNIHTHTPFHRDGYHQTQNMPTITTGGLFIAYPNSNLFFLFKNLLHSLWATFHSNTQLRWFSTGAPGAQLQDSLSCLRPCAGLRTPSASNTSVLPHFSVPISSGSCCWLFAQTPKFGLGFRLGDGVVYAFAHPVSSVVLGIEEVLGG